MSPGTIKKLAQSDIEQEMDYISVFNDIIFTLGSHQPLFLCFHQASLTLGDQLVIGNGFGSNKTSLKIRMDFPCCLRRFCAVFYRPCPYFNPNNPYEFSIDIGSGELKGNLSATTLVEGEFIQLVSGSRPFVKNTDTYEDLSFDDILVGNEREFSINVGSKNSNSVTDDPDGHGSNRCVYRYRIAKFHHMVIVL